jgi:hypothetical protein
VEAELRAAKKSIDTVKENLDRKLNQQTSQTNIAIDKLATRIVDTRTEVDINI